MHNDVDLELLSARIQEIGRSLKSELGADDVYLLKKLKLSTRVTEITGRLALLFIPGPIGWIAGTLALSYYFSVEAQLNHSIMHGAYVGLPKAGRFIPLRYETLALPFQSRTWGDAHRLHHASPSLVGDDPDTVHPLFRVHADTAWRPWHRFNTFIGAVFVFECWAFDYDHFLKRHGLRSFGDRKEFKKFLRYVCYQFLAFPLCAGLVGRAWTPVLIATLVAVIIRNFIFTALQTGSSVGSQVSTLHARNTEKKTKGHWYQFQIETSKNFVLKGVWKIICGGLDRHIEHHLYPHIPPNRLHSVSSEIKHLCHSSGILYEEYTSVWLSLKDSLSHLKRLSQRR